MYSRLISLLNGALFAPIKTRPEMLIAPIVPVCPSLASQRPSVVRERA